MAQMTIKELWQYGSDRLEEGGVPEWHSDLYLLLKECCGIDRMDVMLYPDRVVEETAQEKFCDFVARRVKREPLQYLFGEWEFMGLPFYVNPSVLIPRQDTEFLVEWILNDLEKEGSSFSLACEPSFSLLDVCTGSGCIAISLDHFLKQSDFSNNCSIFVEALDISEKALETAKSNNVRNETKVEFIHSDMFEKVEKQYDLIVSNPPYIPSGEIPKLMFEVAVCEPILALDGMEDGLYFYRILAKEGKKHLKAGGCLYLEIGHDQGETVPALLKEEGYTAIEVRKDYGGNDRCVKAKLPI